MSYKYTNAEFFQKADSEGGLWELIFGYGVTPEEVEPGPVRDTLQVVLDAWESSFGGPWVVLEDLGDDYPFEED